MDLYGILWNSMEFINSMDLHGLSTDLHGLSTDLHGVYKFHGFSMDFHLDSKELYIINALLAPFF
jgi:hypothetical protein